MSREQIPRNGDKLHRVDAEDVQRVAADGLQALCDGAGEAVEPHEQADEQKAGGGIQQDAQRAQGPLAHGNAVGALGKQSSHSGQSCAAQQDVQGAAGQGLVQPAVLLGQIADVKVGHDHGPLRKAEGQLPHQCGAPAQQHDAEHSPVCVFLREDIQDGVQQHPADQQREQIPHGAGGKELLPGISSGVGQPQQKAAGHLEGLGDAAGEVMERHVVAQQMQERSARRRDAVGLEQRSELLLDALADGALAETVAAGNEKGRHQGLTIDEREKRRERQPAGDLHGVEFGGVGQHDGDHAHALEHVEHADGVDGAGSGAFHEKGPSLRRPETCDQQAHTVKNDPFIRI